MKLFFITNDPDLANFVVANGVDRIFIDLEIIGKVERQGHLSTVISRHSASDVSVVRQAVKDAEILVRTNPFHDKLREEIDHVIDSGADLIMLPMFHSPKEVQCFIDMVAGRVRTSLLVETIGAMHSLPEIVKIKGVDEVHIGLNDLHLELKNQFMFQPLADGLVDSMAAYLHDARIPFGIGGIARVGEGALPAELLISEHVRLGSTAAILSRTFHRQAKCVAEVVSEMDFAKEVGRVRDAVNIARQMSVSTLAENQEEVRRRVESIVSKIKEKGVV